MSKMRMFRMKNVYVVLLVWLVLGTAVGYAQPLANGDFSGDILGVGVSPPPQNWTPSNGDVTWNGASVEFNDSASFDNGGPFPAGGALQQAFYLGSNAETLKFEFSASLKPQRTYSPDPYPSEPRGYFDFFQAALVLDPFGGTPSTYDGIAGPGTPFMTSDVYGFVWGANGGAIGDPYTGVAQVSLFLDPSIRGQEVMLDFDLWGELDGGATLITLDNVSIESVQSTVIPAPGALLLTSLGLGAVGFVRRRFLS